MNNFASTLAIVMWNTCRTFNIVPGGVQRPTSPARSAKGRGRYEWTDESLGPSCPVNRSASIDNRCVKYRRDLFQDPHSKILRHWANNCGPLGINNVLEPSGEYNVRDTGRTCTDAREGGNRHSSCAALIDFKKIARYSHVVELFWDEKENLSRRVRSFP